MRVAKQMAVASLTGVLAFATLSLATGCSNQTVRDLEGVPITEPDKVRLITSVDRFPNVTAMCVEGVGFATTTRDAAGAILRVEAWDAAVGGWCAYE